MFSLTAVLIIYNFSTGAMLLEVREFSRDTNDLLQNEANSPEFVNKLAKLHQRYVTILQQIESRNDFFQVYLFVMVGSNVPFLVFTGFRFCVLLLRSNSLTQVLFAVPDIMFCLYELLCLTALATWLHSSVKEFPRIFYKYSIFHSINDENMQLRANAIINHIISQPSFGLTLWDFASISKTLILTIASLAVTYLTLVLQLALTDQRFGTMEISNAEEDDEILANSTFIAN